MLLLFTCLLFLLEIAVHGLELQDVNFAGEAKCKLVWASTNSPSWKLKAVEIGTLDGEPAYFSMLDFKKFKDELIIGTVNQNGLAQFYRDFEKKESLFYFKTNIQGCLDRNEQKVSSGNYNFNPCEFQPLQQVLVLSNPNNCVVNWSLLNTKGNNKVVIPTSTLTNEKFHIPCVNNACFTQSRLGSKAASPAILTLEGTNVTKESMKTEKSFYSLSNNAGKVDKYHELYILRVENKMPLPDPNNPEHESKPDDYDDHTVNDIGENDCCPLVWKPLHRIGRVSYVPKDAILAGINTRGEPIFYSRMSLKQWHNKNVIGFLNSANTHYAYFVKLTGNNEDFERSAWYYFQEKEHCFGRRGNLCEFKLNEESQIHVLANPYNCVTGWWFRGIDGQMPDKNRDIHYPIFGSHYFARHSVEGEPTLIHSGVLVFEGKKHNYEKNEGFFLSYSPLDWRTTTGLGFGTEVLYIDCRKSLPNMFQIELYDMKYEDAKLTELTTEEEVILHQTTVINTSDQPQVSNLNMNQTTVHTFDWKEESRDTSSFMHMFHSSLETGFGFKGKLDGITSLVLKGNAAIGAAYIGGVKHASEQENMINKGKMTWKSTIETFVLDQKITEPPRSKIVITITYKPIKGRIKFKSGYRMRILHPHESERQVVTPQTMENALKRLDIFDLKEVSRDDKYLSWWVPGVLDINAGTETDVRVEFIKWEERSDRLIGRSGISDENKEKKYFSYSLVSES